MNVGYHYTTQSAWEKIAVEGLIPQLLSQENMAEHAVCCGIWIYPSIQTGAGLVGLVLDRILRHREIDIVVLRVQYDETDTYSYMMQHDRHTHVVLRHHGCTTDNWKWHDGEQYELLLHPVPPQHITNLGPAIIAM